MDDFDIYLAEQMKNEQFKKSYLNAQKKYNIQTQRMKKMSSRIKLSASKRDRVLKIRLINK